MRQRCVAHPAGPLGGEDIDAPLIAKLQDFVVQRALAQRGAFGDDDTTTVLTDGAPVGQLAYLRARQIELPQADESGETRRIAEWIVGECEPIERRLLEQRRNVRNPIVVERQVDERMNRTQR